MKSALYLMLALSLLSSASAQEPQRVLSNSDIVNMSKSGIGDPDNHSDDTKDGDQV